LNSAQLQVKLLLRKYFKAYNKQFIFAEFIIEVLELSISSEFYKASSPSLPVQRIYPFIGMIHQWFTHIIMRYGNHFDTGTKTRCWNKNLILIAVL